MKVSVSIVTYQQAGFIRQAVESALNQVADFPFEVIVGDDASTDGTCDVLAELRQNAPDQLRLILAERNYGDFGLTNVMATIDEARGEYIAFLDGDDYWTSTDKLRRQVAFMDAHPDCAISSHRVAHVTADGVQGLSVRPGDGDGLWEFERLLIVNFTPKSATMIRRSALAHLPDWYRKTEISSAAWLFNLLVADGGRIGYIDEVMADHRVHDQSVTAYYGNERMLVDKLSVFDALDPLVPQHRKALKIARGRVNLKLYALRYAPHGFRMARHLFNRISARRR